LCLFSVYPVLIAIAVHQFSTHTGKVLHPPEKQAKIRVSVRVQASPFADPAARLVYLLYQHECFLSTLALVCAMFTVWARGATAAGAWKVPVIVGAVLGIVLLGLAAFLAGKAQKSEGKLWNIRVLSLECDYRVVYAVLAVAAVAMLVAAFLPAATVYLMWVLGIALFAELAYYTTKMM